MLLQRLAHSEIEEYHAITGALVFVWGIADTASTFVSLYAVNGAHLELNPFIRVLLETSPVAMVAVKLLVASVVGLLALWGRAHIEAVPGWKNAFGVMIGVGVGVSVVNLLNFFVA